MTFEDLPPDLAATPLPDLVISDLLDLVVSPIDRRRGSLVLLLCDEHDRLSVPVCIDDVPAAVPEEERRRMVTTVTEVLVGTGGSVLVAVARPGSPHPTAADAAWRDDVLAACRGRVRLLGVWLCTPGGEREVVGGRLG